MGGRKVGGVGHLGSRGQARKGPKYLLSRRDRASLDTGSLRPGAAARRFPGAGLPWLRGPGPPTGAHRLYRPAAARQEGLCPVTSRCTCQHTHICTPRVCARACVCRCVCMYVCVCVRACTPSAHREYWHCLGVLKNLRLTGVNEGPLTGGPGAPIFEAPIPKDSALGGCGRGPRSAMVMPLRLSSSCWGLE